MRTIILASTSPRRKELLEFLGVAFQCVPSYFPEEDVELDDFTDPSDFVATRAAGKALAVAPLHDDAIILGVDTDVFLDGTVFGKPNNIDHAREILKILRGRKHAVITGICAIDTLTGERIMETVQSQVHFFPFSDAELEQYLSTSESLGKAGAYAIQSGAKKFVREIEGSLSNVVGLPLLETAEIFEKLGVNIDVNVQRIIDEHFTHHNG